LLDPSWHGRFACWSIPIAAEGQVAGVMQFGFSKDYEWLPREQELLAAAAERCYLAVEKARLLEDLSAREAQVRQLAEHMLHVEEVERRRISRELHDEAGQSLLWVRLQLEMMEQGLPPHEGSLKPRLRDLLQQVEHTILEIRRLIAALSPAVLEQLGLGAAVRQLVSRFRRRHPCKVRLHVNRIGGLPKTTETIVYRLLQECCNNIAKHSQASTVNISLASADGVLELNVEDDGIGFDVQEAVARRDSFGLAGMRERVTLLGGRFEVTSRGASQPANGNGKGSGTDFKRQENREGGLMDERTNGDGKTVPAPNGPRPRSGGRGSWRSRGSGRSSNSQGTRIRIDLPIPWEG
jgi:signal transduction histidine kinase